MVVKDCFTFLTIFIIKSDFDLRTRPISPMWLLVSVGRTVSQVSNTDYH